MQEIKNELYERGNLPPFFTESAEPAGSTKSFQQFLRPVRAEPSHVPVHSLLCHADRH